MQRSSKKVAARRFFHQYTAVITKLWSFLKLKLFSDFHFLFPFDNAFRSVISLLKNIIVSRRGFRGTKATRVTEEIDIIMMWKMSAFGARAVDDDRENANFIRKR